MPKTEKQIKKLKIGLDVFNEALIAAVQGNPDYQEKALSDLTRMPGWGIVENFFNELVYRLLRPEPFDGDKESYAIIAQGKLIAIEGFEEAIKTIRNADKRMEAVRKAEKS